MELLNQAWDKAALARHYWENRVLHLSTNIQACPVYFSYLPILSLNSGLLPLPAPSDTATTGVTIQFLEDEHGDVGNEDRGLVRDRVVRSHMRGISRASCETTL
jgi:hypothetical protein